MKRKLLSNLITIVFSLSFITTSFPVQSAEENGIVDLSKTLYFPEIENQKSMGSCAAFAATYYQMSYAVNKKLNL